MQDFLSIYEKAMRLYKEMRYTDAMLILDDIEHSSRIHTLQGNLLKCAILRDSGRYDEEIILLKKIEKEFAGTNDAKGLTELYTMIGEIYSWQGDNNTSLANYLKAAMLAPTPKKNWRLLAAYYLLLMPWKIYLRLRCGRCMHYIGKICLHYA